MYISTTIILVLFLATCLVVGKTSRAAVHKRPRGSSQTLKKCEKLFHYHASVKWLAWLGGVLSATVLFGRAYSKYWWLASLLVLVVSAVLFMWHPKENGGWNWRYCALLATPLIKVFTYSEPVLSKTEWLTNKLWPVTLHAGIYEKQDLANLIVVQKDQAENQIPETDLRIAYGGLMFGDIRVGQVMTPARKVKTVESNASISPHLMDEMHASGFSRFPVITGGGSFISKDVVGTLYLRDLVKNSKLGSVADIMERDAAFINEASSLRQALDACIKTHHHLLIVVNSFEEVVGVVSIEDVIEQIVGTKILDEFDQYDDLRAVAAREAARDARAHQTTSTKQTDETVIE